jgi:hypothetical protein
MTTEKGKLLMATIKPIILPCYFVILPDGTTGRALTENERAAREMAAKTDTPDGKRAKDRLALDDRLRTEGELRQWSVKFSRPTYKDDLAIRALASEEAREWCERRGRKPDEATFMAFVKSLRPEILCIGVEGPDGGEVGKWGDIPAEMQGDLAEVIAVAVRLSDEDCRFFDPSLRFTPEAAAEPNPEDSTPTPDGSSTPATTDSLETGQTSRPI